MTVIELDVSSSSQCKTNISTIRLSIDSVILIPAIVERGFVFITSSRNCPRTLPNAITSIVGQMGRSAAWIPIDCTAHLRLQRTSNCHGGRIGSMRCQDGHWRDHSGKQCHQADAGDKQTLKSQSPRVHLHSPQKI